MSVLAYLLCCNSRNARLSPEARTNALSISQALKWAEQAVACEGVSDPSTITQQVTSQITAAGGKVDYAEVCIQQHALQQCRC